MSLFRKSTFKALLRLAAYLALIVAVLLPLVQDLALYRKRTRGCETGLDAGQAILQQPRQGLQVALEQYTPHELPDVLQDIQDRGVGTIRQRVSWAEVEPVRGQYEWEVWDQILPLAAQYDLQVVLTVDNSPAWARPVWEEDNPLAPPSDLTDVASFMGALAARYGEQVLAYQIWNAPNISPHWGKGAIDPAGYVEMLRLCSAAIRAADSDAIVIAGGLAPNTESGGLNMSDVQFLKEIYRRGAGDYFDVLGVQAYGFWTGPYDRRVDADVLNWSRSILLREEMVRSGDANKPLWALEGGWCGLPADWIGQAAPQGQDLPEIQAERLRQAMQRAQREWPWMGLLCLGHYRPIAQSGSAVWGYSAFSAQGETTWLADVYEGWAAAAPTLYPGKHADPLGHALSPRPAQKSSGGVTFLSTEGAEWQFWGTRADLYIAPGMATGQLSVWVDGYTQNVLVDLDEKADDVIRVRLGRHMEQLRHRMRIEGSPDQLAALQAIQVGNRPAQGLLWLKVVTALLIVLWLSLEAVRAGRGVPWEQTWGHLAALWSRLPEWVQWGLPILCALGLYVCAPLRLPLLLLYGLMALLRPDIALAFVVLIVPIAPLHLQIGPGSFSVLELGLLVAFLGRWGSVILLHGWSPRRLLDRRLWQRLSALDWMVLVLAVLGLVSASISEYQRVALREWRVTILEATIFYALLRQAWQDPAQRRMCCDLLWISAVGVAVYALLRYPSPEGVIEAEGVRRARAFYGSPNNLALYLDRLLPLGLAVALWGRSRRRQWLYGLGAALVLAAIALTFSRGALLLGLPAGLLVLAWLKGGKMRWAALALVVVAVAAILTLSGLGRLDSLLDLREGTSFLRVSLWRASWRMALDYPLLGIGPDNFLYYYGDYVLPGAEVDRWLSHPHNLLLDFWLRLGAGGLALIIAMLVQMGRTIAHQLRSRQKAIDAAMLLGVAGGLAAFCAHGLIDASFFVTELAYLFLFWVAWMANSVGPQAQGFDR